MSKMLVTICALVSFGWAPSAASAQELGCRQFYEEYWLATFGYPVDDPRYCGEDCETSISLENITDTEFLALSRKARGCENRLKADADMPRTSTKAVYEQRQATASARAKTEEEMRVERKRTELAGRSTLDVPEIANGQMRYGVWAPDYCEEISESIRTVLLKDQETRPVHLAGQYAERFDGVRAWQSNFLKLREAGSTVCDAVPVEAAVWNTVAKRQAAEWEQMQSARRAAPGPNDDELRRRFWDEVNRRIEIERRCAVAGLRCVWEDEDD